MIMAARHFALPNQQLLPADGLIPFGLTTILHAFQSNINGKGVETLVCAFATDQ